jgi:hypothetical protein
VCLLFIDKVTGWRVSVSLFFHRILTCKRRADFDWEAHEMSRLFSFGSRNDAAFAQSVIPSEVEESLD